MYSVNFEKINKKKILLFIWMAFTCSVTLAHMPGFSTGGFFRLANTGRSAYSMNIAWRFYKGNAEGEPFVNVYDDKSWEVVNLPHGLEYLPLDASGSINYQGIAWYRKHFTPDPELKGKKLFLYFEAIMGKCQVWVNGKLATRHWGGYLPVIADITNLIKWEEDNVIVVKADNSDDPAYPPGKPQYMLDFTYFGGIYRDCWLVSHNRVYLTDANYENEIAGGGLFVSYDKVSDQSAFINMKAHVRNESDREFEASVVFELKDADNKLTQTVSKKISIPPGKANYAERKIEVVTPMLWTPESPYLYYLDVFVKDDKGNVIDGYRQRIGIRSIEFKQSQGLWINGKPYGKIIGTNRHQDFAVLGNALPNSMQWRDVKKIRDAGLKVIRTHYVIDPALMDACDELGMFALVEVPGWQFWNNDPIFEERVYSDIRNMIRIHRNHASLFFWEPILNETDYPMYFAKNVADICNQEYPYPYSTAACDDGADGEEYFPLLLRPKADLKSEKTYFIREWGDNVDDWNAQNSDSRVNRGWGEIPMLLQAQHYAKPMYKSLCLDSIQKTPNQIVGGCFWHSFDHQRGYHTDPFYGGIMDAFRQPKTSYYMFMSQRDTVMQNIIPETGPMIYIAHDMTPFSPSDVTVYSNCDEVRLTVYKNGEQFVYKKDTKKKGMSSPVITFPDIFHYMDCKQLAREQKQDDCYLLAEGVCNGKVVVSDKRYPAGQADHIRLRLDDEGVSLVANGSDVVTVIAEIVDKRGVVKRLNNSSIRFYIEGKGSLIGDAGVGANPRQVTWGSAPVLVQSTTKAGKIKVIASVVYEGPRRPLEGTLEFESVPDDQKELFSSQELAHPKKDSLSGSNNSRNKQEWEKENERLRKELYDMKLKEVEQQQTKFGVGIN